jgi:hypothetical protein
MEGGKKREVGAIHVLVRFGWQDVGAGVDPVGIAATAPWKVPNPSCKKWAAIFFRVACRCFFST